ncbi:hypothetical protein FRC10_008659 [Ceratobasidium sp. 414]|nr:hypothetical protein FRC10_008659 [Ceratobasidium sp. 414]
MHALTRVAAFVFVLLSLSFLVSALPASPRTLVVIRGVTATDPISLVLAKFVVDLEPKIKALSTCITIAELRAAINILIVLFKGCSDDLLKIGAGVFITVEAKTSIVVCICSIIKLLAQICLQVTVKFGILATLPLLAEIDLCLSVLLINLNVCIGGILVLIAQALDSVTAGVLVNICFTLCLGLLSL